VKTDTIAAASEIFKNTTWQKLNVTSERLYYRRARMRFGCRSTGAWCHPRRAGASLGLLLRSGVAQGHHCTLMPSRSNDGTPGRNRAWAL